jgi:hypothetical protein
MNKYMFSLVRGSWNKENRQSDSLACPFDMNELEINDYILVAKLVDSRIIGVYDVTIAKRLIYTPREALSESDWIESF